MLNVVSVAQDLGYLTIPEGMLIDSEEANKLSPHKIAVLCTGSQGEPMAALARLAGAAHRQMKVEVGDTVIIAANPIPGNERNVAESSLDPYRQHGLYTPDNKKQHP